MPLITTIIKHCATGIDGETYDVARIGGMFGLLALIIYTGFQLVAHHVFDPMSFGAGTGAILTGTGAGVGMKAKTEPSPAGGDFKPPVQGAG